MTRDLQRMDGRRAYRVVDDFERELCDFTGAPYAVAVNSCTNAIQLALTWERMRGITGPIRLPRRTYLGVLQAALRAGYEVEWRDEPDEWQERGYYSLYPAQVWDFARCLNFDYREILGAFAALSFHSEKQLPIGRGGAILTDDAEAADWLRAARMDGRYPGDTKPPIVGSTLHCPLPPDAAARGLDILSRWTKPPKPLRPTKYPDLSQWHKGV